MILTLTPNTGLDRTLLVPNFEMNTLALRASASLRASQSVLGMGAKGADVSWILAELGIPSLALGFAGGKNGREMARMLRRRGAQARFVWTEGETRLNTVVVAGDGSGQFTIAAPGYSVQPADLAALEAAYRRALKRASCVVLGGSLPEGAPVDFFCGYIEMARHAGIPVVLDASGAALEAGVQAKPDFIKPNRSELEGLVGGSLSELDDIYRAAVHLLAERGVQTAASAGEAGVIAVSRQGAWRVQPLRVAVVSTAGAGDGLTAGLAWALSTGRPLTDGLALGVAAASAVLLSLPTADCRRQDVERLLPQVVVEAYPAAGGGG